MENEYSVRINDYIKRETERMAKQPEMAMFKDEETDRVYVLVKDTPENIEKFKKYILNYNVSENVEIFYNEPEYYDLIIDGYQTRYRIKEEKERQEKINNPKVDLGVNSKEELIEYLMDEIISNEELLIHEFSTEDYDVDKAHLDAKEKELRRLINKYL